MKLLDRISRAVVVAPHADDDVLGCGGLMARLGRAGAQVHVAFMAVDGFHHYGLPGGVSFEERVAEIAAVAAHLRFTWEIFFPDRGLIEKLDTVPKRDLVDRFEKLFNERRPELLLLPSYVDYDQDHRQTFETAFAAARPIAPVFGKWLIPHVLAYEQTKLNFAWTDLPRPQAFLDITDGIEAKLEANALYRSQLRPVPHVRSPEAIRALARIRGSEIGVEYAEAYQVFRTTL
jgi:LmbE family N-acetylglucosaminyl deacetylase